MTVLDLLCVQGSRVHVHVPYFLEILPHLEIPLPSESRCIFQLAYPNKCHPRNLTTWYGVANDLRMCTHIIRAYK